MEIKIKLVMLKDRCEKASVTDGATNRNNAAVFPSRGCRLRVQLPALRLPEWRDGCSLDGVLKCDVTDAANPGVEMKKGHCVIDLR